MPPLHGMGIRRRTLSLAGEAGCIDKSEMNKEVSISERREYRLIALRSAFTLVEMMIAVAIIVLLLALSIPMVRTMRASSARAAAFNTLNAALQAARAYAIMNGVTTAARFQPNGKIWLVYRVDEETSNLRASWYNSGGLKNYPGGANPNPDGFVYLPVIDREPMQMPSGYAVADASIDWFANPLPGYEEPFYVCYRPDGTFGAGEPVWTGLTMAFGLPVNPDFNNDANSAWNSSFETRTTYDYNDWKSFFDDPNNVVDPNDVKLSRFCYVNLSTESAAQRALKVNDADYYGGYIDNSTGSWQPVLATSTSQIALFATPDEWAKLPIYDPSGKDRASLAQEILADPERPFEEVVINSYTGRVIRQR